MPYIRIRLTVAIGFSLILCLTAATRSFAASASSLGLPDYMDVIIGDEAGQTTADIATNNVLALDIAMFGLYDDALAKFQKNMMAQHPVILALFSNQGGRLILYRPGQPPLEAPPVPVGYQVLKSVGHSALALFELAGSHLGTEADGSWVGPMRTFRAANQT